MVASGNAAFVKERRIKVPNVLGRVETYGQSEHLIEVAVVKSAVPSNRDGVSAHHSGGRDGIKGIDQPLHITLIVPAGKKKLQKAPDGHVSDGEKVVEHHTMTPLEFAPELRLDSLLFGGQERSHRVMDQV
jgi:hypothetical protein